MYKVIQRFCNDEHDNGLLLLDMPTGSGKTYSVLNYIFDAVQNSDDKRRYFFITTLKKNLPIEDLRKRFETAGKLDIYKEKFLFVDSNSESVISGFTKDVIAAIPYEIKKTNEYKKFESFIKSIQGLREKKGGNDLKSILIAAEDKLRTEVEPRFRRYIQSLLVKKFVKLQDRKNAIKTDKDWQWVEKLYPSVFMKDKRIIFMSVDKFLSQNSTIVEPSCMLYNSDLIKDSVIFIDEFDASKDTILKNIIQNGFHRQGIDIEVSSKDLTKLKQKFIDKLNHKDEKPDKKDKTFAEYADEWLNIKKVTTKQSTYNEYVRLLNHDILPVFGEIKAIEIDRCMLQNFLLTYVEKGVLRTSHKLFLLLRCIFDMIAEDYNIPTPMKKVVVPNYQSKSGCAFTYEEEKKLVNHCLAHLNRDTSHAFLVLLYAGLRRSELASLNVIDGVWLECETSKERMGKNVVKRKIPITPMMKQVLPYIDFEKAKRVNLSTLQTTMKRLFPNHHSHELRHTFISRCKESGVSGEVVSIWAGHSLTGTITTTVYTHYSEEFQLREAEKVNYTKWNFDS